MIEPIKVDFKPKWMRDASPEVLDALADTPATGSLPLETPHITTRIVPRDGSSTLTAKSLSDIIDVTQKLASYAANDVVRGLNPQFADLRSMGRELLQFSLLTVEPFEEGSFVIPSKLDAPPFVDPTQGNKTFETEQIVQRFGRILTNLGADDSAADVSIGAIQTVNEINRVLTREASAVEYRLNDGVTGTTRFSVNEAFLKKVERAVSRRCPTSEELDEIEGQVTSLDIIKGELLLSRKNSRHRVKGNFPTTLHPTLLRSLGRTVKLFGLIEYQHNRLVGIYIQQAEILDAD